MLGWSGRVDPDGNIHAFVTCKGALNDGHYCNAEVDKLLNEARTVPDEPSAAPSTTRPRPSSRTSCRACTLLPALALRAGQEGQGFVPYPDGMIRLKGVTFAQK